MVKEMELLNAAIKNGAGMTETEFFAREIVDWMKSPARRAMLDARRYYLGEHDILSRKRTVIGRDGRPEAVYNLPNNRMVDNQYAKLVDQKKNYLLGKPVTFSGEDEAILVKARRVLTRTFLRALKLAGEEAVNGGIAWLYPYPDDAGVLRLRLFPSYEICPFWRDAAHTELDCAARIYDMEVYEGREKKTVTRVDLFRPGGVTPYILAGERLEGLGAGSSYLTSEEKRYNWTRIPLIALKANAREIPLLNRVRELQDALNLLLSDFVNSMEENVHNTILVLKNYDGTDLSEFRRNLATYGAIKTRTWEGASGGVDTLKVEVTAENYDLVCGLLKRSMMENARGCDVRELRKAGNPNQMNIESLYADLDLDANDMETELQAAFEQILWFAGVDPSSVNVIFNRDMLFNESEAVENCVKSMGILSRDEVVRQHPWSR